MCYLFIFTIQGGEEQGEYLRQRREQHTGDQAKATGFQYVSFDLGDRDTGPKQLKLSQYPQDQFGTQKKSLATEVVPV